MSASTLYEIDVELQSLMLRASEELDERGEVSAETDGLIREYFAKAVDKIDRIAEYVKHLEAVDTWKKAEKARLDKRAKVDANTIERLRRYVQQFMVSAGMREIRGRLNTAVLRPLEAELVIDQPSAVPPEYLDYTITVPQPLLAELLRLTTLFGPEFLTPELAQALRTAKPDINESRLKAALKNDPDTAIPGAHLRPRAKVYFK